MTRSGQRLRARRHRTPGMRRTLRAGAVVALGYAVAVTVAWGEKDRPVRVGLVDGAAWVASEATGTLTLIEGHSAEVAARVAVRPPGSDFVAVQSGSTGYSLDRATATVTRVDPTTLDAEDPERVLGDDTTGPVTALATADELYVLEAGRGRVAVTDADDVGRARGRPTTLGGPVRSSVVDATGRLWLLVGSTPSSDAATDLVWFVGTERSGRQHLVPPDNDVELLVVDGKPALIDLSLRTIQPIDDDGLLESRTCLGTAPDDRSVRLGGSTRSDRVYAVSGASGELHVSHLRSGACDVAIELAAPGHELGRPQDAAGKVFVPDHTTGGVAVVDLASGDVRRTGPLVAPGTAFELFGEEGIVFYNDSGSKRAGVVHADGTFTAVDKYNAADLESASPDDTVPAPPGGPSGGDDTQAGPAGGPSGSVESPDVGPATGPGSPGSATTGTTAPPGTDSPATGDQPARPTALGGAEPPGRAPRPIEPPEPPPPQPPVVSQIATHTTTYFAGQEAQLSADVTGTFSECQWTVGTAPVACTSIPGPAGTAELTGTSVLSVPDDIAVTDVAITLTVTWAESTVEQHTMVVLKDLRAQWRHEWPAAYVGPVWITVHTPHPTPSTITIAWGPWRRQIDHATTEPVTYWFRKRDGADRPNVPATVRVDPAANVTFDFGSTPPPGSIDVNAGWARTSN